MQDKKIHILSKKIKLNNKQGVIKITPKAFELLAEVVNESGQSLKSVASQIIIQAIENDLIVYDRKVD